MQNPDQYSLQIYILDSRFRLRVPALRACENREMKREFQRLTWSLREDRRV